MFLMSHNCSVLCAISDCVAVPVIYGHKLCSEEIINIIWASEDAGGLCF